MNVGIRELKLHLSKYLGRVRDGETIVITDRGKPVARLERVEERPLPDSIKRLIAEGRWIDKPPPRHLPKSIRMLPGEKTSTDYVREQRR